MNLPKVWYPNVWQAIDKALQRIFVLQEHSDFVIQQSLKTEKKWGSTDRKVFAYTLYSIVRNYLLLMNIAKIEQYTSKDSKALVAALYAMYNYPLPENFEQIDLQPIEDANTLDFELQYSIPNTLYQYLKEQLNETKLQHIIKHSHNQAPVFLRLNKIKCNKTKLEKELQQNKIDFTWLNHEALICNNQANFNQMLWYKNGWAEVQDIGSQTIAPFCDVKANDLVIDCCAGAGGKSLHIASMMQNKVRIIAADVEQNKLNQLNIRKEKAKAKCIETLIWNPNALQTLKQKADVVLIDAPCSGLGVMRRMVDVKRKWNINSHAKQIETQKKILPMYASLAKKQGSLIYATCSIDPNENENVVRDFLETNKNWTLIEEKNYRTDEINLGDNYYIARLKNIED